MDRKGVAAADAQAETSPARTDPVAVSGQITIYRCHSSACRASTAAALELKGS
jgi:hypothetical protein